jgi:predicted RNA-binding Zn ribbon-like protein
MLAPPFEFIAGSLCLCFADTLGGRGSEPVERIATPPLLAAWLRAADLAVRGAVPDAGDLAAAHRLRGAVVQSVGAIVQGGTAGAAQTRIINEFAVAPPLRPQWTRGERRWIAERPVSAALSLIAADAIEVLGRPDRLRECSECWMLFLDVTRGGRRRWCSSSSGCGNRAKVRRHRIRKAAEHPS